jgi:hypothetical protein
MRHDNEALLEGDYTSLNTADPNVLTFLRQYKGHAVLVVLNMSAMQQKVALDLSKYGYDSADLTSLLASPSTGGSVSAKQITMAPYGVLIAEAKK